MIWQQVRLALLTGAFTVAAAVAARAEEADPPAKSAEGAPAIQYRTVMVTEWVQETVPTERTVYRTETKEEKYTAYRTECVPEERTRICKVYKMVPETREEIRKVCVTVPCVEERTVMKTTVTCKPVTKMVKRCVDKGHWECREVECKPGLFERLRDRLRKKDCCDPCEDTCCVKTKTVRVWVPCKVWEEVAVTCMERVRECKPVTCKVTTCMREIREEKVKVTVCKCVAEEKKETCTVMVSKCVPYEATRKVCVCVPHKETVNVTRCVKKCVEKKVPVEPCCDTACCDPCKSRRGLRLFAGLRGRCASNDCCN